MIRLFLHNCATALVLFAVANSAVGRLVEALQ